MGYKEIIENRKRAWKAPDLMDAAHAPRGNKIPYSSPLMNYATYGGIPRDKVTMYFGVPGGGKTTTAIDNCKNAYQIFKKEFDAEVEDLRNKIASGHKEYEGPLEDLVDRGPKKVLYLDLEHSFDDEWATTLGIKPEEIEIMSPPNISAEEILNTLQELVETDEVGMIVLDSIPSLVTQQELEKKYGERTVSSLAGLMTVFMRKIVSVLDRHKCTLLMINQIRDNMDNPYVPQIPGGQAVKFYSSLIIQFQIGNPVDFLGNELLKSAENPAGFIIKARITKQKSGKNDRKVGSYFLMVNDGIREDFDFANLAITKYGIIKKQGGWFTFCDPVTKEVLVDQTGKAQKVQGLAKVYSYLKDNSDYYNRMRTFIFNDINGIDGVDEQLEQSSLEDLGDKLNSLSEVEQVNSDAES